jgi:hypothetical protein
MGIAAIIFELRSRRRAVACVAVLAILAGGAIGYNLFSFPPKSRQYAVGTGSAQVLIDTPQSQLVAVNPPGSITIGTRAVLLANLMVNGPIKNLIAQQAGLPPGQLYGIAASGSGVATSAPTSLSSGPPPARGYVLTTTVQSDAALASSPAGSELPIIDIETQAPDVAGAARLANAAVAGLQQYVASQANADGLTASQRLLVKSFAAVQAAETTRGAGTGTVLVVAIVLFVAGCALILFIPRLKNASRGGSAAGGFDETDLRFNGMPASFGTFQDPASRTDHIPTVPAGSDHIPTVPARSEHIQDVSADRGSVHTRRWQTRRHGIPGREPNVADAGAGRDGGERAEPLIDTQRDLAR